MTGDAERGRHAHARSVHAFRPIHVLVIAVAIDLVFLSFVLGLRGVGRSDSVAGGVVRPVEAAAEAITDAGADPGGGGRVAEAPRIADLSSPDHPAAVGRRTATFTDTTRGTPARGTRAAIPTRSLQVTIRYPSTGAPGGEEVVDAPSLAPAPLVIFGHGFMQSSATYELLLHDLASFGFVVVAPEFPMSSTVFAGSGDALNVPEQARDVAFLISAVTGADAPAEVRALVAPGKVGLIGQSDGAVTSLLAAYSPKYADARVGAVVAVSGDWDTFGGNWYSTQHPPVLAIHGEKDEVNPFYSSEWVVNHHPGSAMLVSVKGANHLGSVVEPENAMAVARLSAFDFEWQLENVAGAQEATRRQANTPPLKLVVDHG